VRVGFDLSSVRGERTGIGTYTHGLLGALRDFAPEVEPVLLDDGAGAHLRTDRRVVREQLHLPRLARRSTIDILHLTGFAAPFRAWCPVVLTAHDLIGIRFARDYPCLSRLYWSRYLPWTFRFVKKLIAVSTRTRDDIALLTRITPERVVVIPQGRDERFRPIDDRKALEATRATLNLPEAFILFVGSLAPRKGIDTLISAFSRSASGIREDLVIAGRVGSSAARLHQQVRRLGVEKRVHFLGYVPGELLPSLYNLAVAFVYPSRYEGFGLTPLEAMGSGTPTICSDAASLPEVVGEAAVLHGPDDVEGFAGSIARVVGDASLRASLRERGLVQARKFSWLDSARKLVALYREMGEGPPR
jgi:glycosyltransferase involved in cell wall biosynthesis